jgi:hypothetical protein
MGEYSFLDVGFFESIFRLQNAQLVITETNSKKRSPEKMILEKGKAYIYADKKMGKKSFYMSTPHFIVAMDEDDFKTPVRVYLVVQEKKSMIYVLSGQAGVTIARVKEKYRITLSVGEYLEYDGKVKPGPTLLENPRKHKSLLNIFSQFESKEYK